MGSGGTSYGRLQSLPRPAEQREPSILILLILKFAALQVINALRGLRNNHTRIGGLSITKPTNTQTQCFGHLRLSTLMFHGYLGTGTVCVRHGYYEEQRLYLSDEALIDLGAGFGELSQTL